MLSFFGRNTPGKDDIEWACRGGWRRQTVAADSERDHSVGLTLPVLLHLSGGEVALCDDKFVVVNPIQPSTDPRRLTGESRQVHTAVVLIVSKEIESSSCPLYSTDVDGLGQPVRRVDEVIVVGSVLNSIAEIVQFTYRIDPRPDVDDWDALVLSDRGLSVGEYLDGVAQSVIALC